MHVNPPLALFVEWLAPATIALVLLGLAAFIRAEFALRNPVDRGSYLHLYDPTASVSQRYMALLGTWLNAADHFFRDDDPDCGNPGLSLRIGLRDEAPFWTGRSFDRLALLTIAFPIIWALLTWSTAGGAGLFTSALSMEAHAAIWQRVTIPLAIAGVAAFWYFVGGKEDTARIVWSFAASAATAAIGSGVAFLGAGGTAFIIIFAATMAMADTSAGVVATVFAACVVLITATAYTADGTLVGELAGHFPFAMFGGIATGFIISILSGAARKAVEQDRIGAFWLLAWPACFLALAVTLRFLAGLNGPPSAMFLIVSAGCVPLAVMPFYWAALGMNRLLLRWGLVRGGLALARSGLLAIALSILLVIPLAIALIGTLHLTGWLIAWGKGAWGSGIADMLAAKTATLDRQWIWLTLLAPLLPALMISWAAARCLIIAALPPVRNWMNAAIARCGLPELQQGLFERHVLAAVIALEAMAALLPVLAAMAALWAPITFLLPWLPAALRG